MPAWRPSLSVLVLLGAAVLLLAGAGGVPLLDPDESRFARTSVEMLHGGDLVVPHFGGEPRLAKPPLVHWLQTFFFGLFGIGEWSARLHAALATLGSIALVGWIGRRRFGEEGGAWTAIVMATTPLVFVPGRIGTIDALLALHVLAAIALDLVEPGAGDGRRAPAIGAVLGLAFLAKGPVGVILPLIVMLAGRTAARREVVPTLGSIGAAAAAWCVVVLPWGLAFVRRIGLAATLELLRTEALDRYFVGTSHVEPAWFYAKVVLVGFLPWLVPLVVALVRVFRMRRDPVAGTALYCAAGLLAGLAFLALGRGKEASYILPLAPLAAILVAWELGRELEAPSARSLGPVLLAGSAAAAAIVLATAAARQLTGEYRAAAAAASIAFGLGAAWAGGGALLGRPRRVYGGVAAATAVTLAVVALVVFPAIGRRKSALPLIDAVPVIAAGRPLVTVEIRVPSLTFYLGRMPETIEMGQLAARIDRDDDALFIIADVDLDAVPDQARGRLTEIGGHGKFVVFEARRPPT